MPAPKHPERYYRDKLATIGPELMPALRRGLNQTFHSNKSLRGKTIMLRQLADMAATAIMQPGISPCREGCSSCCHQATAISRTEAKMIGEAIGVEPVEQPDQDADTLEAIAAIRDQIHADQKRFYMVPCVFLKDDRCSIYKDRPMICRAYISIEDNAEPCACTPENAENTVTRANLQPLENAYAELTLYEPLADIRVWFPQGAQK